MTKIPTIGYSTRVLMALPQANIMQDSSNMLQKFKCFRIPSFEKSLNFWIFLYNTASQKKDQDLEDRPCMESSTARLDA